jgi:histidine ammonia-lyase
MINTQQLLSSDGIDMQDRGFVTVRLDGPGVTIADVVAVARHSESVELTPDAIERMATSRAIVERLADGDPKYGISTGFGALATVSIPPDRRQALQASLIRSHAAGMGDPVEDEVVRAMILLRARTLALGASGARPLVAQAMLDLLNAKISPVVPEHGSLGASGDLAPLAHGALALLGEGDVHHDGRFRTAADALRDAGLRPITLAEKEGLAVTNGTDAILGMLCLAVDDAQRLLAQADMIAAMTVEGLLATDAPFAADLQALRPHPGQAVSATNLRTMLDGSPMVASHATDDPRIQDAYSIRCTPSVHGAARDTLEHARRVAVTELASAIDNPMVLPDGRVESCGNFHGAPLGFAADFLAIALAEVGAIAERRMDRLLDKTRSHGLSPFLADEVGVDSGLMIGHYTAAAMASENKRLAAPASVDSLPTSGMQEDHVSMAWGAARKLRKVIDNVRRIAAIEYVVAARAIDLRHPVEPGTATGAVRDLLRTVVAGPGPDRHLSPELHAAEELLRTDAPARTLAQEGFTLE